MRTMTIQTGRNKTRIVYVVSGKERRAYVRLARKLARYERTLAARNGVADVAHGFVAGRSPVTMADAHIGYNLTVSMDISNWFESITDAQLQGAGLMPWQCAMAAIEGRVRQGLPSSPAAANLVAVTMDRQLTERLTVAFPGGYRYTRYADDMVVSIRDHKPGDAAHIMALITLAAAACGWKIAEHKTRTQRASGGRRIICGVSVGDTDVRASWRTRHRLRACQHARPDDPRTLGLAEWAACRYPGRRAAAVPAARTLGAS